MKHLSLSAYSHLDSLPLSTIYLQSICSMLSMPLISLQFSIHIFIKMPCNIIMYLPPGGQQSMTARARGIADTGAVLG
ncbi:hypothetical protein BDW59DRAFT_33089 [Aspergillus cavernicola]|uniref:Uncharacterized protein n=1 Tax=Aspergillus cavernicola TaxID=176166 RepID=A0ABR4IPM2_9EURO